MQIAKELQLQSLSRQQELAWLKLMKTYRFLELFSLQLCRLFFHKMITVYKCICSA